METRFDPPVPPGGYRWWYLDALSDDGRHGITLIAFIGSVFSPWYASARRRGVARAEDHCALNVALYQQGQPRWALTERSSGALRRDAGMLAIGPSSLRWTTAGLQVRIDERCAPLPRAVRGELLLEGRFDDSHRFALDRPGHHLWGPIAPGARISVDLSQPRVRWTGHAYFDSNAGDAPLEQAFRRWDWSRCALPDGSTEVRYDVDHRDGGNTLLGLRFPPEGAPQPLALPARSALPRGRWWRVERATRLPAPATRVLRTYEDTPFYARSLLATELHGSAATAMHESLDLDRFASRWVQYLLPFRMGRQRR